MATDLESAREKPAVSDDGQHDQQSSESDQRSNQPDQQSSEPDQTAIEQEKNDNVVDWDGPDDPHNPRNWPAWKRMTQVILASAFLLTA